MSTPAPDSVKRLVDRFDQNRKVFLSGACKKEQPPKAVTPSILARAFKGELLMSGFGALVDVGGVACPTMYD